MSHLGWQPGRGREDMRTIEAVAAAYRGMVVWFGFGLLACLGYLAVRGLGTGERSTAFVLVALGSVTLILQLVQWGCTVVMLVYVYRLTTALGSSAPWAWVIGMFIPLLSLILLVVLSTNATGWLRRQGLAVGLLGPGPASLEALRRQRNRPAPPPPGPPPG
jgi:hypothetical protein